jgi:SNF2 family DNA or RNA helicase
MPPVKKKDFRARWRERKKRETRPEATARRAFVELSEDYKWIEVYFPYNWVIYQQVKSIPGAHFKNRVYGLDENQEYKVLKPEHWRVPRDLPSAEQLREIFGPTIIWTNPNDEADFVHVSGLKLGNAVRSWARQQRVLEQNLGNLTRAKDAHLKRVKRSSRIGRAIAGRPIPELKLPPLPSGRPHPLMIKRDPRPYQRADIKLMSKSNVGNFNQPGTGKTIETIGSWIESDAIKKGPVLVVAPVASLENTWMKECLLWLGDYPGTVDIYTDENPLYRRHQVETFLDAYESDAGLKNPTILIINFDWFRLTQTHKSGEPLIRPIEQLTGYELASDPEFLDIEQTIPNPNRVMGETKQIAALEAMGIERNEEWDWDERLNALAEPYYARNDDTRKGHKFGYSNDLQRRLLVIEWAAVTVDEFHKSGMNNRATLFYLGIDMIKSDQKAALSGTPMGGKPRKLWTIFHWLDPEEFSAEWRWIERWLDTFGTRNANSKLVGGIKKGLEEKFGKAHARWMIRRTKLAVLPGLPVRIEQVIWSKMSTAQANQYHTFSRDLEIKIDEERMSASNILTEYLRLKQFANAKQRIVDGVPFPTEDSGKLDDMMRILDENGIRAKKDDPEPGVRACIGSESERYVQMIVTYLRKKGIAADALVGGVDTKPILHRFKHGGQEPYVIVMTVQTGGVSLDLEEACCMLAMDETWNPDDIEQFFERGDRSTRVTPLRCYIFRTRDTIQEYIAQVNEGKAVNNRTVLVIRQRLHEAEGID